MDASLAQYTGNDLSGLSLHCAIRIGYVCDN